jgi:hypothetical protein
MSEPETKKSEAPSGPIADAPAPKVTSTVEPSGTTLDTQEEASDQPAAAANSAVTDPTEGPSASAQQINPVIAAQVSLFNLIRTMNISYGT